MSNHMICYFENFYVQSMLNFERFQGYISYLENVNFDIPDTVKTPKKPFVVLTDFHDFFICLHFIPTSKKTLSDTRKTTKKLYSADRYA